MKRKLTAVLLAVILVLSMVPLSAGAKNIIASGTCGAEGDGSNLTWELDMDTGTLTISGTGAMAGYTWETDYGPWQSRYDSIQTVIIEDGVTSIGDRAFSNCWDITKVSIPDSVTSIGEGAFASCTKLLEVTISEHVTSIGEWAFTGCSSLTSVVIPATVTDLGDGVFRACSNLAKVTIEDGVTVIPASTFSDCTSLTDVTIPESVTSIGQNAFGWTPWLDAQGEFVIVNDMLLAYRYSEKDKAAVIPDGVTKICDTAFVFNETLTGVTIPDSVTEIGYSAFADCYKLTRVDIPGSVKVIGYAAFQGCSALAEVTIAEGVTEIGDWAFYTYNASMTGVTLPKSVTKIGECALGYNQEFIPGEDASRWVPIEGFTITGYAGTAAEEYAEKNGFTFIPIEDVKTDFTDVKESDWFYTPVQWAVANNVTAGTSATTFSPGNKCTREQAVTFLWNAKGQPEPQSTDNPFKDVKTGAWYYKAVLWAVENNITSGISADTFGVGRNCTRAQIVTFFHNYAEKPAASGKNPFTDVPEKQWYYQPVLWAVSEGVTAGLTPTTFGPNNTCTRGQIVTFLYNYLGK